MSKLSKILDVAQAHPAYESVRTERHEGLSSIECEDLVAAETAIALAYNGAPHAVMMATPAPCQRRWCALKGSTGGRTSSRSKSLRRSRSGSRG